MATAVWPPGAAARAVSQLLWPNDSPADHILCKATLDQMEPVIVVVRDWDEVRALADAMRQPRAYPNIRAIVSYHLPNLPLGELVNLLIQRRARQEAAPDLYLGLQSQLSDIARARPLNLEAIQPLIVSVSQLEKDAIQLADHLPPPAALRLTNAPRVAGV